MPHRTVKVRLRRYQPLGPCFYVRAYYIRSYDSLCWHSRWCALLSEVTRKIRLCDLSPMRIIQADANHLTMFEWTYSMPVDCRQPCWQFRLTTRLSVHPWIDCHRSWISPKHLFARANPEIGDKRLRMANQKHDLGLSSSKVVFLMGLFPFVAACSFNLAWPDVRLKPMAKRFWASFFVNIFILPQTPHPFYNPISSVLHRKGMHIAPRKKRYCPTIWKAI